MKWFLIALTFLLTSCMEVGFKHAMPLAGADIKEFPEELQGTFVSKDDLKDTVRVDRNSAGEVKFNLALGNVVSDNMCNLDSGDVLRHFGEYYVFNRKNADRWDIVIIKMNGRHGLSLFMFDAYDIKNRNRIQAITAMEEIRNKDGELDYLLISPTDEQFLRMIKSKALVRLSKLRRIKE